MNDPVVIVELFAVMAIVALIFALAYFSLKSTYERQLKFANESAERWRIAFIKSLDYIDSMKAIHDRHVAKVEEVVNRRLQ
jgi:hypothetical protein